MAETKKTGTAKKAPAKKAPVKKVTKKEEEKVVVSPIEQILDPSNNENIFLFNEQQQAVEFEQIALIPYADEVYVILRPIDAFEDIKEDEAVVFKITEEENGEVYLDAEENEGIIDVIFDMYYKLYEEVNKTRK